MAPSATVKLFNLSSFVSSDFLPNDITHIRLTLQSRYIRKIICFALGPSGNNIEQACHEWLGLMNLRSKTEVVLCDTPVLCLQRAREIKDDGIVAIFWTCAVYYDLHNLFFTSTDTLPFFISHTMNLDEMQLAALPGKMSEISDGRLPLAWTIAAHPSPAPLLHDYSCQVIPANSNAHAAKMCSLGAADACITTETARRLYGLEKIHSFGSPPMVFFGGITAHGAAIIRRAYSAL